MIFCLINSAEQSQNLRIKVSPTAPQTIPNVTLGFAGACVRRYIAWYAASCHWGNQIIDICLHPGQDSRAGIRRPATTTCECIRLATPAQVRGASRRRCRSAYGVKGTGVTGRRRGHRRGDGVEVVSFNQGVCSSRDVECVATHSVEIVIDELDVLPTSTANLRGPPGIVIEVVVRKGDFVVRAEQ